MNFTSGLALALGGTAALVALAAIFWWLNRTPADLRRPPDPDLPLYSVSLTEPRRRTPQQNRAVAQRLEDSAELVAPRPASLTPPRASVAPPRPAPAAAAPAPATPPTPAPLKPASATSAPATVPAPAPEADSAHVDIEFEVRPDAPAQNMRTAANPAPYSPAPAKRAPAGQPADSAAMVADGVPGRMIEGQALRFSVPQEGTLQFLPGRLEIASGKDAGRDIRFVNVPGPNGTEVTFGRSEGPAYRHVQLREGTVSRSHARMRLLEGTWHLCNLSATNPVVYNGRLLEAKEEQPLADGDRIEMGEVVFGFRSR